MSDYDQFSTFYDAVMGDRSKTAAQVESLIRKHHPNAKMVLELACGTGAILKYLAKDYDVSGLDLSAGMLAVAKREVPDAKFYEQSMTDFKISDTFDVVLCLFDSINHLLALDEWKKVFVNTHEHLNDAGIFIFDMNTEKKLARTVSDPPYSREFDGNKMVMTVSDVGQGMANWNVKIFEQTKVGEQKLHEENIREIAFPTDKVFELAKSVFGSVEVLDLDQNHPKKNGERFYFVCRK